MPQPKEIVREIQQVLGTPPNTLWTVAHVTSFKSIGLACPSM